MVIRWALFYLYKQTGRRKVGVTFREMEFHNRLHFKTYINNLIELKFNRRI